MVAWTRSETKLATSGRFTRADVNRFKRSTCDRGCVCKCAERGELKPESLTLLHLNKWANPNDLREEKLSEVMTGNEDSNVEIWPRLEMDPGRDEWVGEMRLVLMDMEGTKMIGTEPQHEDTKMVDHSNAEAEDMGRVVNKVKIQPEEDKMITDVTCDVEDMDQYTEVKIEADENEEGWRKMEIDFWDEETLVDVDDVSRGFGGGW